MKRAAASLTHAFASTSASLVLLAGFLLVATQADAGPREAGDAELRRSSDLGQQATTDDFAPLRGTGPLPLGSVDSRQHIQPAVAWTPGGPDGGGGSGGWNNALLGLGRDTSADGDLVVAGASRGQGETGLVYVLRRVDRSLVFEAELHAPDEPANVEDEDWFGYSTAISSDVIAVGAMGRVVDGVRVGSAYAFRLEASTGQWLNEEIELPLPGFLDEYSSFGGSVAVDGNVLAVSATKQGGNANNGAVFVYRHDGTAWREEAVLDGASHEFMGHELALSGDLLVAGSSAGSRGPTSHAGWVRVFRHDGASWELEITLELDAPGTGDLFGTSVDARGDELVVGAPGRDVNGVSEGSVYHYVRSGGAWSLAQTLEPPPASEAFGAFGERVRITGNRLLVGAPQSTVDGIRNAGRLVAYTRGASDWEGPVLLTSPTPRASGGDGNYADLAGDFAVLGSSTEESMVGSGNNHMLLFDLR